MSRYKWPGRPLLDRFAAFFRRSVLTRPAPNASESSPARFEAIDVNATAVLLAGIAILLVLWLVVVIVYPLFLHFRGAPSAISGGMPAARPPQPQLQANPRFDLEQFRAREDAELTSYHWVDRKHRLISIPIDQAIDILAHEGIAPVKPSSFHYYSPRAGSLKTGFEGKVEPKPR
jgi:hypothetical protein